MIISRYLVKELFYALLAVTFVLLLIFLGNQLVRFLSYAASGKIAVNVLLQIMGFEVAFLLALLLPLGLYLGIIGTYGRLYADNELRIIQASGFGIRRLVQLTATFALIVMLLTLLLTLWVNPYIAKIKDKLISQSAATSSVINNLMPGRFQVSGDENRVFYVENIARNHQQAQNLFIAEQKKMGADEARPAWTVVSAATGYQMIEPLTQDKFVVAVDGYRYEGTPGQNAYKIIQFKKYAVRISDPIMERAHLGQEMIPTSILYQHYFDNPKNAAELQWRISMPLSAFLLALLAIPCSYVRPRQSRYAPLFPAILIYVIYVEMLFAARDWVDQQILPISVGLWWVHGLLILLIILLFLRQTGKLSFLRKSL
ncbi:MAG: lptF [Gammaproteobacteria bacterium]|jgi:lipopolysaccharide export system permease protein|nr:lptF [Gammaproteobacteria bacterium]